MVKGLVHLRPLTEISNGGRLPTIVHSIYHCDRRDGTLLLELPFEVRGVHNQYHLRGVGPPMAGRQNMELWPRPDGSTCKHMLEF